MDVALKLEKHRRKSEKWQKNFNENARAAGTPLRERVANSNPLTGPPVMLTPIAASSPVPGMPLAFPLPMPIDWGQSPGM